MGISIGSNRLVKYVGEKGKNCPFEAITCIANPWDVSLCMKGLGSFWNKIYNYQITKKLKKLVILHKNQLKDNKNIDVGKQKKKYEIEKTFHDSFQN